MKHACKSSDKKASFNSGQLLNRTGSKIPSPLLLSLMKWVTGQVRCHVTGRKPTRNRGPVLTCVSAGRKASKFNHKCRMLTVTIHATMTSNTHRFADIGKSHDLL